MQPLRRSQRQRIVSKRKSDSVFIEVDPQDSIKLSNSYFKAPRAKIELTDVERELLEERQEIAYCLCGQSETDTKGQVMVQCDICDNWFHDECVGLTAAEAADVDTFVCPQCSNKPKSSKKRSKPSHSEIEILLGALEELDNVDRPRMKKKSVEPKTQAAKVAAYHLPCPTNLGRYIGVVGYLRNESHPTPTLENEFLVPITHSDIEQGVVYTPWGVYRVAMHEGQIAATRDYNLKIHSKESLQGSDTHSTEDTSVPVGRLEVYRTLDSVQLSFENLPEVTLPLFKVSSLPSNLERLEKAMNVELNPEAVKKYMKDRLKIRVSILGLCS